MLDLLVHGAEVVDGTGSPRRFAEVGVQDGRLRLLPPGEQPPARRRIDARGRVVAPGFIDAHTHDDRLVRDGPADPARHPKLLQGVTTVVTGNCGVSLAPLVMQPVPSPLDILGPDAFRHPTFADYLRAVEATAPATHVVALVGHTTLRVGTVADLSREAAPDEQARMAAQVAEALEAGAWGLSTGLYYPPARAATAAEVEQVGAALKEGRGLLTMHLRDEGDAIDAALDEALAIARALAVPLVLSHHKLMGLRNHGRSSATLARIDEAARWQPVCMDCYPYAASSTMLLPERVAASRDVQITWSAREPGLAGQSLRSVAAARGMTPEALAEALQPGGGIYFAMSDEDVQRVLVHPLTMIGSDGLPHDAVPHPRLWGSFPRVLGHCVRELNLFPLETAIHKMTGLPAARFGLPARGMLCDGAWADLVVLDPAAVADHASYASPLAAPAGLDWVMLEGRVAVAHGEVVDLHCGRVLRRGRA